MARGKTLTWLLDEVRAEARLSLNPAHNAQVRDTHVRMLQSQQERLWEDFTWPHLIVHRYIPVQAGSRFYDPNGAINLAGDLATDLHIDNITKVEFKSDGEWMPVTHGTNAGHYAAHDSDLNAQSWPVCTWQASEEDQIEIWPIPDTTATAATLEGYLRLTGMRNLRPLVDAEDRCDLDGRMLAMYVAGFILAAQGAKDAQIKLEDANKRRARLGGLQIKTKSFKMFGLGQDYRRRRPVITRYIPAE